MRRFEANIVDVEDEMFCVREEATSDLRAFLKSYVPVANVLDLLIAAKAWDLPEADFFIKHLKLTDKVIAACKQDTTAYIDILAEEGADARLQYWA